MASGRLMTGLRHRDGALSGRRGGAAARLSASFPGLLGPSRRAAYRRFVLLKALSVALMAIGCALAFLAGAGISVDG